MLKIGVDAMGGDFAPEAAVKGAVMAVDAIGDECRISEGALPRAL